MVATTTANDIYKNADEKMQKTVVTLKHDLAKIRTGRAHASVLDDITVPYYNAETPLNQLASIMVEDARTLLISPFDKSVVAAIDKAIRAAGLGFNPVTTGQVIRLPLPPLTEERRVALVKQTKAETEKTKVSIRNIRRDANQHIKDLLKSKTISEDEQRRNEEKIQKLTDKFVVEVDKLSSEKETDLMQI